MLAVDNAVVLVATTVKKGTQKAELKEMLAIRNRSLAQVRRKDRIIGNSCMFQEGAVRSRRVR